MDYKIRFPDSIGELRNEEYFFATYNGIEHKHGIQEYDKFFDTPALYKAVTQKLGYQSPKTLAMQLAAQVLKARHTIDSLVVLDIAAGSGLAGEALADLGISQIVGVDIIPEAFDAVQRDCPDVYDAYYIEDLTNISPKAQAEFQAQHFNCLVCCSSITCHFPIQGFINSSNFIENGGWIAFNVAPRVIEDFENPENLEFAKASEFGQLYAYMLESGGWEVFDKHYYRHRFLVNGKAIDYVAVTVRKIRDVPANWQEML